MVCLDGLGPMSEQESGIPECLGNKVEIDVALVASGRAVPGEASGVGRRVCHTCHEVVAATTAEA